jgi:drug/metabolite transporter (DMT)-like permease
MISDEDATSTSLPMDKLSSEACAARRVNDRMQQLMFSRVSDLLVSRLAVPVFIFIWASGYIVAKLAAHDAEALTFLLCRYLFVVAMMGALALAARAPWPSRRDALHLAVSGVLIHAVYLGGVWVAIRMGISAGLAALIVNLQPVLTVCFASWTGDAITRRQWLGVAIGFAGVVIVLSAKLLNVSLSGFVWAPVLLCVVALLANTIGVIYQKKHVPHFDLRTGQVVQFVASALATLPMVFAFEQFSVTWSRDVIIAMLWSVIVLSGGGVTLMFYLLRSGSAMRVTSTMYVVPGLTALMAWLIFDETLTWNVVVGMGITLLGVYLVVNQPKRGA